MKNLTFPFVCLPDAAVWQQISSHAKVLFAALIAHKNRKTGLCNPALNTLAERLGKSLSTIRRALAQLVRAGMILVHRTLFGNRYDIATQDQWQTTISVTECALKCERSAAFTDERTQRSRVSAQEPDVLNHIGKEPDADAAVLGTPGKQAAAAATTFVECKPEKPTPPAPGGSPGSVNENSAPGHMAETEMADLPKNFPGNFFPAGETAAAVVAELMAVHPEPGNAPKAISEVEKLVASTPGEAAATLEALRTSHGLWRARWAGYAKDRFIPQLWRWVADGDWRNPPAERKGVKSETWVERRTREYTESQEKTYRNYAENEMWGALRECGGDELVEVWRAKVEAVA